MPVEVEALNPTESGAGPLVVLAVITALSAVVSGAVVSGAVLSAL